MPRYKCPKHDKDFDSFTDDRKPGSQAVGNHLAHPANGHPDCDLCMADAVTAVTKSSVTRDGGASRVSNV